MQPVMDFIVEDQHLSYPLIEGKCLSAMSPYIPHQEIEEEGYQSFIAISVPKDTFEAIYRTYSHKKPVFKGEAYVPQKELVHLMRMYILRLSKKHMAKHPLSL